MVIKIWGNKKGRQQLEDSITYKILTILDELKSNNISFTSGDADNIFRALNKIYFKPKDGSKFEPTTFQREIIFEKYPEIFPRKKSNIK